MENETIIQIQNNDLIINTDTNNLALTDDNEVSNIYIKKRKSPKGFRDKDKEFTEDQEHDMAVYMKSIYSKVLSNINGCEDKSAEEEHTKTKTKLKSKTVVKKAAKIEDSLLEELLNKKDSIRIQEFNLSLSQYKKVAKHYKLKISGNKSELSSRIYSFLYFFKYATIIQKHIRGKICRKYIAYYGPAYMDRSLCTNDTDFVTMEPLKDIPSHEFFSYKDLDGFIYGFHISSIYNILFDMKKTGRGGGASNITNTSSSLSNSTRYHTEIKDVRNPYNRRQVPSYVLDSIRSIIRISKMFGKKINLSIEDETTVPITSQQNVELRALSLFQTIDSLGHYSNSRWFLSLNKNRLIRMMRELIDIWNYRAQLSNEKKREICHPHGNPFMRLDVGYLYNTEELLPIQIHILETLELLVNSGIDNDNKYLGATYILGAITLVNQEAASAMPWLYESVIHI
jgi:hypothetical protein